MKHLKDVSVVFFDADDTIVELSASIGELYSRVANQHSFSLCPNQIDARVREAWNSIRLEYRNEAGGYTTSPEREKAMWLKFIGLLLDDLTLPEARELLYEAVYEEFAYARSRKLKPGIVPFVDYLRNNNYVTGVLSNNDSRIIRLMEDMGLDEKFDHIIPTASIGFKKPSKDCFLRVRELIGLPAHKILYIGDNFETDYLGAKSDGWHALFYNQHARPYELDASDQFTSYSELLAQFKVLRSA